MNLSDQLRQESYLIDEARRNLQEIPYDSGFGTRQSGDQGLDETAHDTLLRFTSTIEAFLDSSDTKLYLAALEHLIFDSSGLEGPEPVYDLLRKATDLLPISPNERGRVRVLVDRAYFAVNIQFPAESKTDGVGGGYD